MAVQSLLKPQVKELLNKSIASELYASNLYKYLANQMQRLGLFGCQKYFLKESAEELTHYQEIVDYINDLGDIADMPQVDAISDMINGIGTALNLAYETEKVLLYQYVEIYEQVEDEMEDCITAQFLLKFIKIQRKAVGEYGDLISRLERNPTDVFMFDDYLGEK
jgi:ferritin